MTRAYLVFPRFRVNADGLYGWGRLARELFAEAGHAAERARNVATRRVAWHISAEAGGSAACLTVLSALYLRVHVMREEESPRPKPRRFSDGPYMTTNKAVSARRGSCSVATVRSFVRSRRKRARVISPPPFVVIIVVRRPARCSRNFCTRRGGKVRISVLPGYLARRKRALGNAARARATRIAPRAGCPSVRSSSRNCRKLRVLEFSRRVIRLSEKTKEKKRDLRIPEMPHS